MTKIILDAQRPSKRATTKKAAPEVESTPATVAASDTEEMQVDADPARSKGKRKAAAIVPIERAAPWQVSPARISTSTLPVTAGPASNAAPPTRSKKGRGLAPPSAGAGRAR